MRKFDKNNISDYVFYVGKNKYDREFNLINKIEPKLKDSTDKELIWNIFLSRQDSLCSAAEHIAVVNVFELNWVLNGHLYSLYRITDREKFDYELRTWLMNQLWSRCQYEILIGDSWDNDVVKIDAYTQIMVNWFHFEKYCWEHKRLFKKFKSSHLRNKEVNKYWRNIAKKEVN